MNSTIRSVAWLNQYVADQLTADPVLQNLAIVGEISGGKLYPSGHYYFTLKDREAQVSCVFFGMARQRLNFRPENGMKVVCHARATLYGRDGRFQLIVARMEEEGVGDLHTRFLQTKTKLEAAGLFAAEHKIPLPFWPKRIGVITSASGAVLSDMLFVLRKDAPSFDLLLYPVAVQGPEAAGQIAHAIQVANAEQKVDVLIVGRGGGSFEDLYAFNEEVVVCAIFASTIPIISAVGHETDVTLADFAADLRMPTPTAAAARVMPKRSELLTHNAQMRAQIVRLLKQRLNQETRHLQDLLRHHDRNHPEAVLQMRKTALERQRTDLQLAVRRALDKAEALLIRQQERQRAALQRAHQVAGLALQTNLARLRSLSPTSVLARGYALVTDDAGRTVSSVATLDLAERLLIRFQDGRVTTSVEAVEQLDKESATWTR